MFGNDRNQMRRFFYEVRRKQQTGQPLGDLERLVGEVIERHPEYHNLLVDPQDNLDRDYSPELGGNPFLHMGMHIAIQEQLSIDRPAGILEIYQALCQRLGDSHRAEHQMMEVLGEILWQAQSSNAPPDEQRYWERLQQLTRRH
ncbi:MAG: DUF1841 family protein [Candidatus Competibacteraceae bacterium]|nr:DUF1841 family protein [Candidatus Competibacteraceae bacterium]